MKSKKTCKNCGRSQPLTNYHRQSIAKDQLQPWCKDCQREWMKNYTKLNAKVMLDRATKWQRENPERTKINVRRYYAKKQYNLTLEEYDKLREQRICDVCKTEHDKLNIDHCHKSGKVRGVLCKNCNIGLGMFKDQEAILRQACDYLKRTRAK